MLYDDYIKERDQLSKGEQANYDSSEKAILTLSASFLAFSVSFVALFKMKTPAGVEAVTIVAPELLGLSWLLFALSVLLMLLNFVITAKAFRREIEIVAEALEDIAALNGKNSWSNVGYSLYVASLVTFISGIGFLLLFCAKNLHIL